MHRSSFLRMEWFKKNYLDFNREKNIKILDVGSYDVNGSYKPLFYNDEWEYFGLDIESGPNVDIIVNDNYNWSGIPSESFDVIISGQAFEHIEFFWLTMKEIERVLKINGLCCIIAPSSGAEHKYPVDCYRFYEDGMKALAKSVGFEILYVSSAKNEDNFDFYDQECEWKDSILVAKKIEHLSSINTDTEILIEKIKYQEQIISAFETAFWWRITKPIRVFQDSIKKMIYKIKDN